ncbi:MAG: phosphoenolpyruvate--protein phosphotransferase, partial [Deltaproteobacteria bacterium]
HDYGGPGLGLYRPAHLLPNRRHLPTEEEHFEVYKSVLEGIAPHPATIRTFDLGGDKFVSSMRLPEEVNPALGLRAIRLCLEHDEIFRVQLRALLRASVHGKLRIMFPLISGIEELKKTKEILEEIKAELARAAIPFDPDVEIGTMIEVPSAAVIADLLAEEVDFFSIGTNDLIQYALAIDRINEHVSYLYEPLHPAILRMLRMIVEAAHNRGIPVSICGEMAAEELYTLVLLGLGVDQLSMTPISIPRVKQIIRESTIEEAKRIAEACMTFSTAEEIERFVANEMATLFPEHFMRPPDRPLPTQTSKPENIVVEHP